MVENSRFIQACWGQPHDTVPVWFMRQAGRYQPSYRALRQHYSMLELARSPHLMSQVTVAAVEELGVDAAILFSDIMIPLDGIEVRFEIQEHVGPIVPQPLRSAQAIAALPAFDPSHVDFVYEGARQATERLGPIPLIGFAGAPFTLASYLIEGGPSRTYHQTKSLMWTDPPAFGALMEHLADLVIRHVQGQVQAGAACVQLFDSWVGVLSRDDYQRAVLPSMQHIFRALRALRVPLIYFAVGAGHLIEDMAMSGATVLGVDWRWPLTRVRQIVGPDLALMGNLDPGRVVAGSEAVRLSARPMVESMRHDPRYVFNLGHGVAKESDPAVLKQLVSWVHQWGQLQ